MWSCITMNVFAQFNYVAHFPLWYPMLLSSGKSIFPPATNRPCLHETQHNSKLIIITNTALPGFILTRNCVNISKRIRRQQQLTLFLSVAFHSFEISYSYIFFFSPKQIYLKSLKIIYVKNRYLILKKLQLLSSILEFTQL